MPPILKCLADLLYDHKFIPTYPNQIIVNRYLPGQGIGKHTDSNIFEDIILSLSLGSPTIMTFAKGRESVDVPLIPGSLLIMANGSRIDWTHSIAERKSDSYKIPGLPEQKWQRGERLSVTFRTVKKEFQGADLRK